MKLTPAFCAVLAAMTLSAWTASAAPDARRPAAKPPIDIVFAIDCSGSMGGVIETAKQKVWDIVNEIATAKPVPHLRIGLLAYGNGDRTFRRYDLSDDLDTVYKNLMTFKDEGWGDEYVGMAVRKSVEEMSWAKPAGSNGYSLRILYVVGNETARQGPEDYKQSAPDARKKDIFVNAIYCGDSGGQETWQQMAALGGGKYLEIAGDGGSVMIATPYDKKLAELNARLNATYVGYGALREEAKQNQAVQDTNAATVGGGYSVAARAMSKASGQYNNAAWDLVDASRAKDFDLAKIPTADLPAEMRKMTLEQRRQYLVKKTAERAAVQKEILDLGRQRSAFIETETRKRGDAQNRNSLDRALRSSTRSQAAARGFKF